MTAPKRRAVRPAVADRMGFAWEPDELVDMDLDDAREILSKEDAARAEGQIGNEDTATLLYARQLLAAAKRPPS